MNLIIDLSILIHANYYIIKKFANKVDATGLANKIVNQVDNLIVFFQQQGETVDNVVCVADSKKNFRKSLYKEYKAHRKKNKELNKLKDQVINFVSSKLDLLQYNGLEADDIIYLYSRKHIPAIIVTNDMDLLQCLNQHVRVYLYQKQELIEYNLVDNRFNSLLLDKCLRGDKSDNIKRSVKNKRITSDTITAINNGLSDFKFKSILKQCTKHGITLDNNLFKLNRKLIVFDSKTYEKYIKGFDKFYDSI